MSTSTLNNFIAEILAITDSDKLVKTIKDYREIHKINLDFVWTYHTCYEYNLVMYLSANSRCGSAGLDYLLSLDEKININYKNSSGENALTVAVKSIQSEKMILTLLQHGIDIPDTIYCDAVSFPVKNHITLLRYAVYMYQEKLVKYLIENHPEYIKTALMCDKTKIVECALFRLNSRILKMVLEAGAPVEKHAIQHLIMKPWTGYSETQRMVECVRVLLKGGYDVDEMYVYGNLLMITVYFTPDKFWRHQLIDVILNKSKKHLNQLTSSNYSALSFAIAKKYQETAIKLLKEGADISLHRSPSLLVMIVKKELFKVYDYLMEQTPPPLEVSDIREITEYLIEHNILDKLSQFNTHYQLSTKLSANDKISIIELTMSSNSSSIFTQLIDLLELDATSYDQLLLKSLNHENENYYKYLLTKQPNLSLYPQTFRQASYQKLAMLAPPEKLYDLLLHFKLYNKLVNGCTIFKEFAIKLLPPEFSDKLVYTYHQPSIPTPSLDCKICFSEEINIILPCHHAVVCSNCSKNISKCPVCNALFQPTDTLPIYYS